MMLTRVLKEDPVKGRWNVPKTLEFTVWSDESSIVMVTVLEVVEDATCMAAKGIRCQTDQRCRAGSCDERSEVAWLSSGALQRTFTLFGDGFEDRGQQAILSATD